METHRPSHTTMRKRTWLRTKYFSIVSFMLRLLSLLRKESSSLWLVKYPRGTVRKSIKRSARMKGRREYKGSVCLLVLARSATTTNTSSDLRWYRAWLNSGFTGQAKAKAFALERAGNVPCALAFGKEFVSHVIWAKSHQHIWLISNFGGMNCHCRGCRVGWPWQEVEDDDDGSSDAKSIAIVLAESPLFVGRVADNDKWYICGICLASHTSRQASSRVGSSNSASKNEKPCCPEEQ